MPGPYDRLFKTLAEDDPRGLLHLFGSLPLEVEAEIQVIDRELNLPTLSVDHVYRVRTGQKEWLAHYEVQTHYESDVPERLAWYGQSLALKFKIPIETVLILLVERHAPKTVPTGYDLDLGSIQIQLRYRVARLWEIDPEAILKAGRPSLLPWVTLTRSSQQDLEQAARQITSRHDRKLAAEFVVLGGLRYDKNDLAAMLGKVDAMLTEKMIEESSFYQMVLEKGIAKGIEKGIEKGRKEGREEGREQGLQVGRLEQARRNVRRVLALRFSDSEIGDWPKLDLMTDIDRLEALFEALLTAKDPETARSALERA